MKRFASGVARSNRRYCRNASMISLTRAILFGRSPEVLYIYGYLNCVQSSRRLEREAGRNVELMWLLERRVPDHKTIADFRRDNGEALKKVCARFIELCREMGLLAKASVAIDGSKFKAVNNRDKNFYGCKGGAAARPNWRRASRYPSQLSRGPQATRVHGRPRSQTAASGASSPCSRGPELIRARAGRAPRPEDIAQRRSGFHCVESQGGTAAKSGGPDANAGAAGLSPAARCANAGP